MADSHSHYGNTRGKLPRVEARCNLEVLDGKQVNAVARPVEDCPYGGRAAPLIAYKTAGVRYSLQLLCLRARTIRQELSEHVPAKTFETLLRNRDLRPLHDHHVQNVEETVCGDATILLSKDRVGRCGVMENAIVGDTPCERQRVVVTFDIREVGSRSCVVDCVAKSIQMAMT